MHRPLCPDPNYFALRSLLFIVLARCARTSMSKARTVGWLLVSCLGCCQAATADFIDTVLVGNPGNAPIEIGFTPTDTRWFKEGSFGAVSESFRIGTTEVTNDQYVAFLNAVAATNNRALYRPQMTTSVIGGILQTGENGSHIYESKPLMGNKPVVWVSLWDAMRFANWLHNGMPTGPASSETTDDGAYFVGRVINPEILGIEIVRKPGARWFIPSEDEWFKAAYHKNDGATGNYYEYPTASDDTPAVATADELGNVSNPGDNVANYSRGADWNSSDGNVTTVGSAGSTSAYGTFDQAGNVDEYTDTELLCIDSGCNAQPPEDLTGETIFSRWIVRGGTWHATEDFHITGIQNGSRDITGGGGENNIMGFRVAAAIAPPLVGDYNLNGIVDVEDYTVWRSNLGQSISLPNEDPAVTPGVVTIEDYELWKAKFGATQSNGSSTISAPEPASLLLLIFAEAVALLFCRFRRCPVPLVPCQLSCDGYEDHDHRIKQPRFSSPYPSIQQ